MKHMNSTDNSTDQLPPNAIAVIGMAGRFPGAGSVTQFWDNLRRGEESIVDLSAAELTAAGVSAATLANPAYVRRAAPLDGIENFDADFFGITPYDARMMDPQHRLLLETAWHAFEDSGYDPVTYGGAVGVFGSSSDSGYLLCNLMSHLDPKSTIGEGLTVELGNLLLHNGKDYLATHVSHAFNLRGPSLSVQTACSSGLVAVHLACQSLLSRETDIALAGAASIRVPHRVGYWYMPGLMVSAVGRCRPFDVRADGVFFGSGVAAVVLKPLKAAVADGDRIHAVIRGSAVNNDGSMKMNYAAPNPAGQAEVIAQAHAVAGVDAATIGFVETHGTGTHLGDALEIEGLRLAFEVSQTPRTVPCVLGSVKSNIGHLEVASGIAGLIKAILCLKNKAIPPTLHYTAPNPELHLERTPFVVQNTYAAWESDAPRRAGVNCFGAGGTNAHIVLEEAPAVAPSAERPGPQVLLLSARTAESLHDARTALADKLCREDELALPDIAYTLAHRRREEHRLAAGVHDRGAAAAVLTVADHDDISVTQCPQGIPAGTERVAFLFPGEGAQHVGMALGLFDTERVFREHFDRCTAGLTDDLGIDLKDHVFAGTHLERTDLAQPALFTVEYALAQLAMSYGVKPAALAGHSIGELVAATVAGVFDLPTALKVVALRARLMHAAPGGAMVAVAATPEDIAAHLGDLAGDVDVAAVNDPGSCVLAGPEDTIAALTDRLAAQGIPVRRARTSHAFHSRSMDEALPRFAEYLASVTLHEPTIPMLSNITGTWMTAAEATDPERWARHIRSTVRFADEIQVLLGDPHRVLVEVGPGLSLTESAVRLPTWGDTHRAVRLMRHPLQRRDDRDAFLLALGQFWSAGVDVDWTALHGEQARRVTLPGYPFARQRHWIEPADFQRVVTSAGHNGAAVARTAGADPRTQMLVTLQRIWADSLGVESVKPSDNFSDLGGNSLTAVGVAMSANQEGLDLTALDLVENRSLAALADTLIARYASAGLTSDVPADLGLPLPPNICRFLDTGVAGRGGWRVPLVLGLDSRVGAADVIAVVSAVISHHDALRMRVVERSGTCEQQIAEPCELTGLVERALPSAATPDSVKEREALAAVVTDTVREQELQSWPLTVTYVTDATGAARFLVLTVHRIVCDTTSRKVLVTDLLTAFAQRLAGQDIILEPVGSSWRAWSQRCAALSTHPALLDQRGYWLDTVAKASLRVAEPSAAAQPPPATDDLVRLPGALTTEQTSMIDNAQRLLQVGIDALLLSGLARTVAAVVGEGVVAVDLVGAGRSVLEPEVHVRRTVGWFSTIYPIALPCVEVSGASAVQLLEEIRQGLKAVPHYGVGYGVLRYLHAPTARLLEATAAPDIHFANLGMISERQASEDSKAPARTVSDDEQVFPDAPPGLGHPIELRAYRRGGALHVDYWYDRRRVPGATIEALAARFPAMLIGLVDEAVTEVVGQDASDADDAARTLVELSAAVFENGD